MKMHPAFSSFMLANPQRIMLFFMRISRELAAGFRNS